MQKVQKTKRISGKTKGFIALFALAFFLVFLLWANGVFKDKDDSVIHSPTEERLSLIEKTEAELLRFTVRSSKGDVFTIVHDAEGYSVLGQPDFSLDALELELMVRDLTLLFANEEAGEVYLEEEALALLGLGRDAARVSATYQDGSEITLVLGNSAQTEIPADYLMVQGSNKVYTVSTETRDHFDRELNSLHTIPAINFKPELVKAITFEGKDPFQVAQVEGLWEVTAPFLYPARVEAVQSLLSSVGKMRFALFAGKADSQNLEALGLQAPLRLVTFHLYESLITGFDTDGQVSAQTAVPAQEVRLQVGGDIDNIGLYLLYEGVIYQASNVSMGFLRDTSLQSLLSPHPMNTPINRLDRLVIISGGITRDYQIEMVEQVLPNNQIATDQDGNTLFEPFVSLNGQDIDREAFLKDYLALLGLERSGRLPQGYTSTEAPVKTYTFYQDGATREVALVPYDALHYAIRVNGIFVDYVTRQAADALAL